MKKSSERFLKESEVNIWLKEITLIVQPELQIVVLRVFLRAEHFLWNLRQTLFWKRSNIVAIMKIHRLWNIMKSSFHSNAVGCQMPKIRIVYFLFLPKRMALKVCKLMTDSYCKIWKLKENREKPQISRTTIKMQWLVKRNLGNVCGMDGGRKILLERLNLNLVEDPYRRVPGRCFSNGEWWENEL